MSGVSHSTVNGTGTYLNGSYNDNRQVSYGRDGNDRGFTEIGSSEGRSRDRRPGGYGGLTNSDSEYQRSGSQPFSRPAALERSRANRRSGDRDWSHSRSRSRQKGNQRIEGRLKTPP